MPIKATPDHELKIMKTVCSKKISLEDIEHYQYTVWMEPSVYGYNELFDFSDSDYSDISFADLIHIAETASKLYMIDPKSRFAFLTHNLQHQKIADFYIATKALIKAPSRTIKSFKSYDEAMQWLTEDHRKDKNS